MRKVAVLSFILLCVLGAANVNAAYYVVGSFQGWDPENAVLMTDNGDGTHSYTVSGVSALERHTFKILDAQGPWGTPNAVPNSDSWLYADLNGQCTITFTPGPVDDGWLPAENRIGLSVDPGSWTVVSDYYGWSNTTPLMEHVVDGIYKYTATLPNGTHQLKATYTGTWDAIGEDNRSVNAANIYYTVTAESETVDLYVDACAGVLGLNMGIENPAKPHVPDPAIGQEGVDVDNMILSWEVAQIVTDPNSGTTGVDPNLVSHDIYIVNADAVDPNLVYHGSVTGWDAQTLRASYSVSPALDKDAHYLWRVDMVYDNSDVIEGVVWDFYTELTTPVITAQPDHQLVAPSGTATFEVAVDSPSTPTYQWYEVDGGALSDGATASGATISGAEDYALTISNAQIAEEGKYYCIVNNDSSVPAQTDTVMLGVKRKLAHWSFDTDMQSDVADSPASIPYNDPALVADAVSGMALECDADPNSQDMLIVDPDEADYFDTCSINLTVAAWIKAPSAYTWGPIVSRNGEDGQGWQLRHNGSTLDRISLTTRGVGTAGSGGAEEGVASNSTVYDGDWHYAVGTYDGAEKKLYIDGVVCRVYSSDNGSIVSEGEAATGIISETLSPLAIGGRVKGNSVDGLNIEAYAVTECILDEVEIYNYALDAAVIAQTYATLSGSDVCPAPVDYDLNDDCKVNIDDFALMASSWLVDTSVQP